MVLADCPSMSAALSLRETNSEHCDDLEVAMGYIEVLVLRKTEKLQGGFRRGVSREPYVDSTNSRKP